MTHIEVDRDALVLVDLGHIFWREWYKTESRQDAYRYTVERCERLVGTWPKLIVCADSPTNWRHALTTHLEPGERYKANRKPKPKDAFLSLVDAEETIAGFAPFAKVDDYEADDLIATLKNQAWLTRVLIMSEDKDLAQLVDESTLLWTRAGERGPDDVMRTWGVPPHLMRDLLAMWGDSSDNIQGCDGLGQKHASALLNHFGSIEAIKEAASSEDFKFPGIGPSRVEAIKAWDHTLAVKLVSLAYDAPINLNDLLTGQQKENQQCQTATEDWTF
jgi:5'-3' exonuclease